MGGRGGVRAGANLIGKCSNEPSSGKKQSHRRAETNYPRQNGFANSFITSYRVALMSNRSRSDMSARASRSRVRFRIRRYHTVKTAGMPNRKVEDGAKCENIVADMACTPEWRLDAVVGANVTQTLTSWK